MIRYRILTELTFRKDLSHPEVAGGEPDDGGLVQLTRDGRGQREQLPELEEFGVFLLSPISRGVLALVLLGHRETESEIAIEVKARGQIGGSFRGTSFKNNVYIHFDGTLHVPLT